MKERKNQRNEIKSEWETKNETAESKQNRLVTIATETRLSAQNQFFFFRDISERNNDYSDTLDFRRGRVEEVVTFFVLEVPN